MVRVAVVVFLKEARDLLRDWRTLFFLFAPPILGPLLVVGVVVLISWQVVSQAPEGLAVAVVGADQVPELVNHLESKDMLRLVDPVPDDPIAALRNGELMALLTIPPDSGERVGAELPITLTMTTSRVGWLPSLANLSVREVVTEYSRGVLAERLNERGLDSGWAQPLRLVDADLPAEGVVAPLAGVTSGEPMSRSFNGLMVPLLVATWSLGGGLGLMAYMTVGEKERNTMESLLTTVASRVGLVLGKITLSMVVSLLTVALWSISGMAYLLLVNVAASLGAEQAIPPLAMQAQAFGMAGLWLFLLMVPMMTMTSSVTAAVCTFARNYREAGLFTSALQLGLPALSFVAAFVAPATPHPIIYGLPFFGVLVAVRDLFLSGLPPAMLILTTITSSVYAVLSILMAAYVFSREWALMRGL